mmetsp:Transcript_40088/g.100332  ORF Transcript_40088/g.100332 Transcript_40088/m.100332 type:complete len:201 (-) Transcript_40088:45-647(-)
MLLVIRVVVVHCSELAEVVEEGSAFVLGGEVGRKGVLQSLLQHAQLTVFLGEGVEHFLHLGLLVALSQLLQTGEHDCVFGVGVVLEVGMVEFPHPADLGDRIRVGRGVRGHVLQLIHQCEQHVPLVSVGEYHVDPAELLARGMLHVLALAQLSHRLDGLQRHHRRRRHLVNSHLGACLQGRAGAARRKSKRQATVVRPEG